MSDLRMLDIHNLPLCAAHTADMARLLTGISILGSGLPSNIHPTGFVPAVSGIAFAIERSAKVLEHHLVGEERQVLKRWLGAAAGEWTGEQRARFSAAFQRFLWDGSAAKR
jgi:hypothetical protein